MSSEANSRNPVNLALTLADALAAVQAADLPDPRRQEMASALHTIGRAFGKPLEHIPASPRVLAKRMILITPEAIGISRRRWNNVRSLARAALVLIQPMAPGRYRNTLSPAWQRLSDQLRSESVKGSVSRPMRFFSAHGIEPGNVTDESLQFFCEHLNDSLKIPSKVRSINERGWAQAQAAVADWPKPKFARRDRRGNWTLPFAAFPNPFSNDCEVWLNKLAGRDPIDEPSFPPVCEATLGLRRRQIRSFASALVLQGRDPTTIN